MNGNHALYAVRPLLIKRRCGGWLAITPKGWPLGIGVTAETEAEAVTKFREELDRLSKIEEFSE